MTYLPTVLRYFIFMGIWHVLSLLTGTMWECYELALHGELMPNARDSYLVMAMSLVGAIRLKVVLDEWVDEYVQSKD